MLKKPRKIEAEENIKRINIKFYPFRSVDLVRKHGLLPLSNKSDIAKVMAYKLHITKAFVSGTKKLINGLSIIITN